MIGDYGGEDCGEECEGECWEGKGGGCEVEVVQFSGLGRSLAYTRLRRWEEGLTRGTNAMIR